MWFIMFIFACSSLTLLSKYVLPTVAVSAMSDNAKIVLAALLIIEWLSFITLVAVFDKQILEFIQGL